MEIGSIYEMAPQEETPGTAELQEAPRLKGTAKYGRKHTVYTASGRDAIALSLLSLEAERPGLAKRCLLPAYMCDSVFLPFERAGWELFFYSVDRGMEADVGRLSAQMAEVRPGLLFIHPYYGVDTWRKLRPSLRGWRDRGLCVMEDVTQSYYLDGIGQEADYVVGSLRKWFPVPDGGFVSSDASFSVERLLPGDDFAAERGKVLTAKWEYLHSQGCGEEQRRRKEAYLERNRELEGQLDSRTDICRLSALSAALLGQAKEGECGERRRENCRVLWEGLRRGKEFQPALDFSGRGAAPLYFPLYTDSRAGLQQYLRERDIYAPVLWPVGEANKDCLGGESAWIFDHLLALPLDQRYGEAEMERIVKTVREYGGRG